jgi:Bacterial Ig-like domain (group 2)
MNFFKTLLVIIPKKLQMALLIIATLMSSSCGGGGVPTPTVLTSIAITPVSAIIASGQNAHFTAIGTYSNALTADITNQVRWASGNTSVATINSTTGIATGVIVGVTTVTASVNGISSQAVSLTVTTAVITGISISPSIVSTPNGMPVTFTATGTYSDGNIGNVSGAVSWATSNATVATLSASGIASALTQGTTIVTASANGVLSNSATLTVSAPQLTSITINPTTTSIATGHTINFIAIGTYTDGSSANITSQVTWGTSNFNVATSGSNGVITTLVEGITTVTASASGITSNSASLIVSDANNIAAWGDSLTPGFVVQLRALLPSRTIFNGGVGGQPSTQIAARQGGIVPLLTVAGDLIPASGSVDVVAQSVSMFRTGYSYPAAFSGKLADISGIFSYDSIITYKFTRNDAGTPTIVMPATPFIVDTFNRNSWINVFWYGRNNPTFPAIVKADIAASVAFLSPGNQRFIVISILNGSFGGESLGGAAYNGITQLNSELGTLYPQNYLDIRAYLVSQYNPAIPQDVIDFQNDVVPSSLRSDAIHLTTQGSLLVAQKIQEFIHAKGW